MRRWGTVLLVLAASLWVSGAAHAVTIWTGALNSSWDLTTENWTDGVGLASPFNNGDDVLFDDTGVIGGVSIDEPGGVIVDDLFFDATGYTITGTGLLQVAGSLGVAPGVMATISTNVSIPVPDTREFIVSLQDQVTFTAQVNGKLVDDWLADHPDPAVLPLPTTVALILTGLLGLGFLRRAGLSPA